MNNKIIAGTFNVEREWINQNIVKLLAINSFYYDNIICAMDELMTAYSSSNNDIVVTQTLMDDELLSFLESLGVQFRNESYDKLCRDTVKGMMLETYAVTQTYINFAKYNDLVYAVPEANVVKKVNSKFYSVELSKKLGINNYSVLVENIEELEQQLIYILETYGMAILKEEYGVSGKGNLLINTNKMSKFLSSTIRQIERGKSIRYIIEPYFEVVKDFSSQWFISKEGTVEFISIQEIRNNGGVYGGSIDMKEEDLTYLREKKYFEIIKNLGAELYKEGYYGDICIDSMIIKDNRIIYVVEINARKSMSLTKYHYDNLFTKSQVKNKVSYIFPMDLTYKSNVKFGDILHTLRKHGVGYDRTNKSGVIPVTCNTLFCNRNVTKEISRGRIYYYVTSANEKEIQDVLKRLKEINMYERSL